MHVQKTYLSWRAASVQDRNKDGACFPTTHAAHSAGGGAGGGGRGRAGGHHEARQHQESKGQDLAVALALQPLTSEPPSCASSGGGRGEDDLAATGFDTRLWVGGGWGARHKRRSCGARELTHRAIRLGKPGLQSRRARHKSKNKEEQLRL